MGSLIRGLKKAWRGVAEYIPLMVILALLCWFCSCLDDVMKESREKRKAQERAPQPQQPKKAK